MENIANYHEGNSTVRITLQMRLLLQHPPPNHQLYPIHINSLHTIPQRFQDLK